MNVLDTDILSLLVYDEGRTADDQSVAKRVSQRLSHVGEPAAVTIVTIEEQMRGWLSWIKKHRAIDMQVRGYVRLRRVLELPRRYRVLDFDQSAGKIFEDLRSQRLRIGTMDLKMESVATLQGIGSAVLGVFQ